MPAGSVLRRLASCCHEPTTPPNCHYVFSYLKQGGPLEPSALGGAPILVLCLLGLVSVAWAAFGAASFGRERDTNTAKGAKGSISGDRTPRPPAGEEDVRAAPPSMVGGKWATSLPAAAAAAAVAAAEEAPGEQALPPSAHSENGSTRDGIDGTVCFSDVSSYTMRSSELAPPSDAAERGHEPGASGGAGGVGMFFNGNEWRRGGRGGVRETDGFRGGVDAGVFRGSGGEGAGGRGRESRRRRHCFCDVDGERGAVGGQKESGVFEAGEEEGEGDHCRDSSRASSSVADLRSLEVARWDGPTTPRQRWRTESEAASNEEHGLVERSSAAAGSAVGLKAAKTQQSVLGREAGHATAPVAAAAAAGGETKMKSAQTPVTRHQAGTPADDQEESNPPGGEEAEGGEQERRLLTTVKALLDELERDLDAARVLLPECHRFRKVVGCVSQAVGPGMDAGPRQVR